MLDITLDNRNGRLWSLNQLVSEVSWKTSRIGRAGSLTMSIVRNRSRELEEQLPIDPGNVLRVRLNDEPFFWGYVFAIEETEERVIRITAYDQLRYLMYQDTFLLQNVTARDIVLASAQAAEIEIAEIADTKYVIKKFNQDGQSYLDMIYTALDQTLLEDGRIFVLYDDFGKLVLKDVGNMKIDLILGDNSLVYGYSTTREIDSETYNRVKLTQDNSETGKRESFVYFKSDTMARWGVLQYYQKVDETLNEAQIEAIAKRFLELRNREMRQFSISALGYPGMRAGVVVQITLAQLGLSQNFLVEECTHKFIGQQHTMEMELRVYG